MKALPAIFVLLFAVSATVLLTSGGCTPPTPPADDGDGAGGGNGGGDGDGDGGGDGTVQAVSFANQIQPIFDANCTVCHVSGGIADTIMHLNAEESFDALVGQASVQDASLTRVVAGDSGTSLLFEKVSSNSPPVGARMPLDGAPLSDADIALIGDWIDEGAANN